MEPLERRKLLVSGAGTLDPFFGLGRGYVINSVGEASAVFQRTNTTISGVFTRSDGKIVVAAVAKDAAFSTGTEQFLLERLNPDGSLDTSFGPNGVVTVAIPYKTGSLSTSGSATVGDAVVMQADGKILEAGAMPNSAGSGTNFAVVRINVDGSIDPTYGQNGLATLPAGASTSTNSVSSAALQPNGDMVLLGSGNFPVANSLPLLVGAVRLNTNGTLDTGFGAGGTAGFGPNLAAGPTPGLVAILPDGGIIAGVTEILGEGSPNFASYAKLIRLNADGSVDSTFGGTSPTPIGTSLLALAVQTDNKIVGVVATNQGIDTPTVDSLIRLDADGVIDPTFGDQSHFSPSLDVPTSVAIQVDGKIVEGGGIDVTSTGADSFREILAAKRFNSDGSADTRFGNTSTPGLAQYSFGAAINAPTANSITIQPDGNLLLAGIVTPFTNPVLVGHNQVVVARLLEQASTGPIVLPPPPTPPASFDGSGRSNLAVYLPSIGAFAYRPTNGSPDQIIPFGIAGAGQSIPVPADYTGDGKADLAVYLPAFEAFAIRPSEGGPDQIIPFGIAGTGQSIPAFGDYDGSGRTELAVDLPAFGVLAYRPANGGPDVFVPFGAPHAREIPTPGDYSGSGQTEVAIYDPTFGTFAYRPAGGGPDVIAAFGIAGVGQSIPRAGASLSVSVSAKAASLFASAATAITTRSSTVPIGPMTSLGGRLTPRTSILQDRPSTPTA